MGIFDRIRQFFSRSDSPSRNTLSSNSPRGIEAVQERKKAVNRSYRVEQNRPTNFAGSQPPSRLIDRPSSPSCSALQNSILTQTSSTSHTKPDVSFKTENSSCKGFGIGKTGFLSGDASSSAECKLSRSSVSQRHLYDNEISNQNISGQKCLDRKPSLLKSTPTECKSTAVGISDFPSRASGASPSEIQILQSKNTKSFDKCTDVKDGNVSNSTALRMRNVNKPESQANLFSATTRLARPSSSISPVSGTRDGMPAKNAKPNNSVPLHNQNNTLVSSENIKTYKNISKHDGTLDHNKAASTLVSSLKSKQGETETLNISEYRWGITKDIGNSQQGATPDKYSATQTSNVGKSTKSSFPALVGKSVTSNQFGKPVTEQSKNVHSNIFEQFLPDHTVTFSTKSSTEGVGHLKKHYTEKSPHEIPNSLYTCRSVTPIQPCKQNTLVESKPKYYRDTKHQYSLRNFSCKLKTAPKDKDFKPEDNVIYHNQWTECNAMILDEFSNLVSAQKTVYVSSDSFVDIHNVKIVKGRLHFTMRSSETGYIPIFIEIDNFTVTKELYVTCNPCSSSLSDMIIENVDPSENEFVFRVYIFDVFGEPLHSEDYCELEAIFQSDESEVKNEEMIIENGQICYDITVRGERPWSQDLVILINGEQVQHPDVFEMKDEECEGVDDLDEDDYDWILGFLEEDDDGLSIPLMTGVDDGQFIPYNENDCELQVLPGRNGCQLVCQNTRKREILGEDFAHIDNIRRVLEFKDHIKIEEPFNQANVVIPFRNVQPHLHSICKEVVQHLLRGLYYRKKASEAAQLRMEWKNTFISLDEVLLLDQSSPSVVLSKYFKDFFGNLLNKYNREACEELFKFFNFQRDASEVDLHGLLVADEEKLELLRSQLLIGSLTNDQIKEILQECKIKARNGRARRTLKKEMRKKKVLADLEDKVKDKAESSRNKAREEDVESIIRRCRLEGDEAIRKLKETLDNFNHKKAIKNKTPWLEIIVGAGRHSKNEQRIRPKVEKLLKERNLEFASVNKGALVVTFKTYSGPEPCFGEYYCENCDRSWKSSKSYVENYQKCSRCRIECFPVKQREKERGNKYYREGGNSVERKSRPHQSSLCQRCLELGYPCNEEDFDDSDY